MAILKLQQQNVAAAAAYTEYSVVVPPRVNQVTLALRPGSTPANIFWYVATSPNATNNAAGLPTVYGTIPPNASRTIWGQLGGQTIFFQADQTSQTLEADYYGDT